MGQKKVRKKANIPEHETKEQRFIRVVTPRVQQALKKIAVISNCTSPAYGYAPEQANKIIQALLGAVTTLKAKFDKAKVADQQFSFTV